jgi:hypothetical protein
MKHLYYDINDTNKSSNFGIRAKYGNDTAIRHNIRSFKRHEPLV